MTKGSTTVFRQQLQNTEDKNLIEKGFTLVELLIVIVIMGILAGIVVFAVSNLTDDASKNACATDQSTVNTAIEAYHAKNQAYPATKDDLIGDGKIIKKQPTTMITTGTAEKNHFKVTFVDATTAPTITDCATS